MISHSRGNGGGFFIAREDPGQHEIECYCEGCYVVYVELFTAAVEIARDGRPFLCLSCDDEKVTGEVIYITTTGAAMVKGG